MGQSGCCSFGDSIASLRIASILIASLRIPSIRIASHRLTSLRIASLAAAAALSHYFVYGKSKHDSSRHMRHIVPQLQRLNLSGARSASMPLLTCLPPTYIHTYLCARAYDKTCHGFFCTMWHHAACRGNPCKFQQSPSMRQEGMIAFSTNRHPRNEKRVSGWNSSPHMYICT